MHCKKPAKLKGANCIITSLMLCHLGFHEASLFWKTRSFADNGFAMLRLLTGKRV